jgi:hypothetical protein
VQPDPIGKRKQIARKPMTPRHLEGHQSDVVGPVLLIGAQQQGARFAAAAATGTLFGLTALSAFAVVYSRVAVVADWRWGLVAGWASAGFRELVSGLGVGRVGLLGGLLAACASLAIARGLLPRSTVGLPAK